MAHDKKYLICENKCLDEFVASDGLTFDGSTIKHSNSVTASTGYIGSATKVPMIKYDAQGHIIGTSSATIYPPTTVGTSGQIWTSDGAGAGKWVDPADGVWEEIDLTNWPTDWTAGERYRVRTIIGFSSGRTSSWSSSPTAPYSFYAEESNSEILELCVGSSVNHPIYVGADYIGGGWSAINILSVSAPPLSQINDDTMISITAITWNGNGAAQTSRTFGSSDGLVAQAWRLKQ